MNKVFPEKETILENCKKRIGKKVRAYPRQRAQKKIGVLKIESMTHLSLLLRE